MGASRIKGITVEIGGDTTKLSKSLKDVNTNIKNTQNALKDVNKLLKLDPKNTELLAQKQKLLKKAVEETKTKLDQLKQAEQAMKDNGQVGTEEWDALQREIADTEQQLKTSKQELNSFGSVGAQVLAVVGQKMQEVGEKVTEVGEDLTKKLTAPIVALGTASVAAFNQVDDAMDIVRAKTGATGEDADKLEQVFNNLAESMNVDMNTVGNAVGEVATRFGVTGSQLEDLSRTFIEFAELNNTDVTNSIDMVQNALAAFGMSVDDAETLLDVMNRTGQNTGVSMETLQSGLVNNAEAFQQMGLNGYEAVAFMGKLATAGADSESVMSGLKRALKSATEEGVPFNDMLNQLEESIVNGTDDMDGLTYAYDLFGKSGAGVYTAIKNGSLSFQDLASSADILDDSLNSVSKTYANVEDDNDQFAIALNNVVLAMSKLGESIGATVAPMLEKLSSKIQEVKEWYDNLDEGTKNTIVTIGLVVAAIGPVLAIVGSVISFIGTVISTISTVMTVCSALAPVIAALTGPIGWVIAAIAAVIAIGVALVTHWDEVKAQCALFGEELSQVWDNIKSGVQGMVDSVGAKFDSFKSKCESLKSKVTSVFSNIKTTIQNTVNKIKGMFNFSWSLPHISLPHFSISPSGWSIGDLLKGSIPSLSISWYKKAMNNAMVLDGATIFGMAGGNLLGGGEAGREVISGESHLMSMINGSVDSVIGARLDSLYEIVAYYMPQANQVYIDGTKASQALYKPMQTVNTQQNNLTRLINGGA